MTLEELTRPLTPAEVQAAIFAAIVARGGQPTNWAPGSPSRSIVAGLSIVVSSVTQLTALVAESGFLERARGPWLDLVAQYVYGVTRRNGTFASGTVLVSNSGGGIFTFDPGDLIVLNSTTGKGYRNTAAVTVGSLATNVSVAVQAIEIGSESTALPSEIDALETPLPGLTVDNLTAIVGTDPEDDAALKVRCSEKIGTLSPNGARDSYNFVARAATLPDGTSAGVTRVSAAAFGDGDVWLYVGSATGPVAGSPDVPTTALGAVNEAIQRQCVPLAVTATVLPAVAYPVNVTYSVTVRDTSGLTNSQIQARIGTALANFFSVQPIGGIRVPPATVGYVRRSQIEAAIDSVIEAIDPDDTYLVSRTLTTPAADVELSVADATVLGSVTATVTQIPVGVA